MKYPKSPSLPAASAPLLHLQRYHSTPGQTIRLSEKRVKINFHGYFRNIITQTEKLRIIFQIVYM